MPTNIENYKSKYKTKTKGQNKYKHLYIHIPIYVQIEIQQLTQRALCPLLKWKEADETILSYLIATITKQIEIQKACAQCPGVKKVTDTKWYNPNYIAPRRLKKSKAKVIGKVWLWKGEKQWRLENVKQCTH